MSKQLEKIAFGASPLTDRMYLGTVSARDAGLWASKIDCTSKFLAALMDWTPPGTIRTITDNHGNTFEVEVRKVAAIGEAMP
jgi:hypothetical protein